MSLLRDIAHTVWYALTARSYSLGSLSADERKRARLMMWGAHMRGVTKVKVDRKAPVPDREGDEG